MKPLRTLIFAAALAASCSKSDPVLPDSMVAAYPETVSLGWQSGATAEVTVTSEGDWTILPAEGFTALPASGKAGTTVVTLTAARSNTGRKRLGLGEAVIAEPSGRRTLLSVTQAQQRPVQSLLVFLTGTGNLASYFTKNIRETVTGVADARLTDGRVLLFRQQSNDRALLLEAYFDPQRGTSALDTLRRYTEPLCTTEAETFTRLLGEMIDCAPAERYGLIMGSHATAWVPAEHLSLNRHAAGDRYWQPAPGADLTRWYGYDRMQAMEIDALGESLARTGVRFDYLLFDACFMSSIETLYALRSTVHRIIASPCEIMGYGFPYHRLMPALFNAHADYDLEACCRVFHDYYSTTTTTRQSGCIALTECAELDALAEIAGRIFRGRTKSCDPALLQTYEGLSPHLFYDFRQYVEQICDDPALLDEFRRQFDRTFPERCRLHTPQFYSTYTLSGRMLDIDYYSGVTVSEPSEKYTPENRQTAWYRATH